MKRMVFGALGALALSVTAAVAEYPEKEIQGIIQWGAGGSTDTVMRSVTPHAEDVLGGKVVLQNITGGVGAIALNQVAGAKADGYTLLMGAENPLLYKVLGLGKKDYSDFIPINVLARGTAILVASPDAPFDDYAGMMEHIKANPGAVRFGSTGPGGLPSVITAMIESVEGGLDVIKVPYDGDGPALTALQGGAIDVMPAVLGASIEFIRAGSMKPLAVFDTEANKNLPDAPTITSFNAGYEAHLPWGPFFGVFVPNGTPDDVVAKLTEAYKVGAENADFIELMDGRGFTMMNISGAEAQDFLTNWQQGTAWLLQDAGLTKASPEEFGIARPAE
ncbi:MAG TPA: tripartite tricarboxylate transporter substrate binding protein [Paracoccus sp. (in: a-proteobacteria)]|uniref:Bug family tripartite tricarboxylate transporter substrate binding protein n=1 Tax=uncultured Paracoccus sp. TaxID=189685 RepID=UPI0026258D63|nr:tripartite tricarboxylate transporter substrate binding protein [uncultured Paracoccus sp.]HMQ41301.1 tripartite tricarboxylate transporter substrate binding protein [Paracoccus sp. (in: a-proteobacteria)]HMR36196.1 tripartite tricarboxylate transporter substrate binding protein [Paracoccus sp. (in: a-proteobacteria)]